MLRRAIRMAVTGAQSRAAAMLNRRGADALLAGTAPAWCRTRSNPNMLETTTDGASTQGGPDAAQPVAGFGGAGRGDVDPAGLRGIRWHCGHDRSRGGASADFADDLRRL